MKRQLTLLLAGAVASSCMSVTGLAANFKDINDVPWAGAQTTINSVADLGLLNGYEDNTFRARNNVTYAEAMHMVYTVLEKTGTSKPLDATDHYKYIATMNAVKIPQWSQRAVAYGLNNSILSANDLAKFMTGGKNNFATREDVAKMFGNALAVRYDIDRSAKEAYAFNDAWRISEDAVHQIDLLARLGIVSGDNGKNFQPKNNINRAEMAVMLNKTYELLKSGTGNTGTISKFEYDGNTYKMNIKTEIGDEYSFFARPESTKVYIGDTKEELPLSRLSAGDKISFLYNGGSLETIRVLNGSNTQTKYDITGYITSLKSGTLTLENENTGATQKYDLDTGCSYFLDGKSIRRADLETALNENSDQYAYAGLNTKVTVEKDKADNGTSTRVEKTFITEVYVTFSDEHSLTGEVKTFSDTQVAFKAVGGSNETRIYFASGCAFYIDEKEVTLEQAKTKGESGTVYVKVTVGKDGKATKIILSEESFQATVKKEIVTYKIAAVSNTKLVLESAGNKTTYSFGSDNPTSNINFYRWDVTTKDWVTTNLSTIESLVYKEETVYCRVEYNSGGKISKVSASTKRSAWSDGENPDAYTDRKGIVESLSGNTLKFKDSSTAYTMLNQYNARIDDKKDADVITGADPNGGTGQVKNPLTITSAKTSSLTVFSKMATDKNVTLYADIKSDGRGYVQKIDARLTEAKGTLVSYDRDEKLLVMDTADGNRFSLVCVGRPSLGTEDFTLDDLGTTGYVGSTVELSFKEDGEVSKIYVTDSTYDQGTKRVRGIATSATPGLQVEGVSKTFTWLSRTNTEVKNYSMNTTSLDRVKELIDDEDISLYVEARISDRETVEGINVYARGAKGAFQEYNKDNGTVRIKTADGNSFTFNTNHKPDIDIDGIDREKINVKAFEKPVKLTFNGDGVVTGITGR